MTWSGKLDEISLETILRGLVERRAAGRFSLRRGDIFANFQLANGRLIAMDIDGPEHTKLGNVLLLAGQIDEKQLKAALKRQKKSRMPIGSILSGQGVILKDTLTKYLHLLTTELLLEGLGWRDGQFQFSPGESGDDLTAMDSLDIMSILKERERQAQHLPTVSKWVPDSSVVYEKRGRLEEYFKSQRQLKPDAIDLDVEEKRSQIGKNERLVYSYVDGKSDVRTLSRKSSLTDFRTRVALANLLATKLVGRVKSEAEAVEPAKPTMTTSTATKGGDKKKKKEKEAKPTTKSGTGGALGAKAIIAQTIYFLLFGTLVLAASVSFSLTKKELLAERTLYGSEVRELLQHHQKRRIIESLNIFRLETMAYPTSLEKLRAADLLFGDDLDSPRWTNSQKYTADPEGQGYRLRE
ncbi:MAG: DUF4388 domain-containing protein [Myxococcales bacterium]|nr:DUF4388 domain-containing protein [Myxococcales bacterium]